MGLMLPPELAGLLAQAGGHWPEADEDALHGLAGRWRTLAADLTSLGDEASSITRTVAAEHHGDSVDAFTAYAGDLERTIRDGANAAEQTATGVDAMAQAILETKTAMVAALRATHARIQEVRSQAAAIGAGVLIGILIGILLRILARVLLRLLAALLRVIARAIVALFKLIGKLFKKLWEWLKKLVRRDTKKPRPPRRISYDDLNRQQKANYDRYKKKLPSGAKEPKIERLPNGDVRYTSEVPGRVPGSRAEYIKTVDESGDTVRYVKRTYDQDGNLVHEKQKYP